uniref:SAP domain-containing protein n=1 Tax=Meloidogyne hapla TaxID=6305 RepID=A0A1I8B0Z4_MELHA
MGTNGNVFYSKQQLNNNNNAFLFVEDHSLSTTTATSPFPPTYLTSTNIATTPIHRVYSGLLEEPSSTTGEIPEEWNGTNQSNGLNDLRVHELKTECKKRQLAVSGSKQALINRLQPFEHQIMLQQQKESLFIFNEGILLKKKNKKNVVVVDSSPTLFSSNNSSLGESGCCSPSVIDAVIDSVIDGSGFSEGRNLKNNNSKINNNKIKKEQKTMILKNNRNIKQKRTTKTSLTSLGKSKMFFSKPWHNSFMGCKCCSCGHNNNVNLNNKNTDNEECLFEEEKRIEEEEEDKIEELREEDEEEGKEEEKDEDEKKRENICSSPTIEQQMMEKAKTFSFAQMGSGGQFTPLEPADISIVISEDNKTCCKEEKHEKETSFNLAKHQQTQQSNNPKTFLEPPQTSIKQKFNNVCCNYCCPTFPCLDSSFNKNNVCEEEIIKEQQKHLQNQNEQNQHQLKHQPENIVLIRENEQNNNIHNTNCCCCLEQQNQQCFVGTEHLLSVATLSKHEELLRQQQQKIGELQRELTLSQIGLQKHQQMLAEARRESQPKDPETGIVFGQVEYWLGQLINTHKEQQLTLERQMIGQRSLVYAEQKLQEELHTEQAVQDICRLIGQESKTALLIVQLLRRYQLEHNNTTEQPPLHSENSLNVQEEEKEVETKTKRKVAKKPQNITTNIKRKGASGRSRSALEGLISNEQTKNVLKRSSCECFDNNINQKRPNSSLAGTTNSVGNHPFDMEEIFRSVLEGNNNNVPIINNNNSPQSTTSQSINQEFSNNNIYEAESQLLIEEQRQQQSFEHIIHNQEMEKTMQDLMEVLQNDQYTTDCTNNNTQCNNSQTDRLANFLAEEVEMHRNNSSAIFSSSFTASTLFQDSNNTPQQTSTSFSSEIIQNQVAQKQIVDTCEDSNNFFFNSCEENERVNN